MLSVSSDRVPLDHFSNPLIDYYTPTHKLLSPFCPPMSSHNIAITPRRILTPVVPSRKRKEREPKLAAHTEFVPATPPSAPSTPAGAAVQPLPSPTGNHLLAGYMAHEFLTKGTLLGQKLDLARPDKAGVGPAGGHRATDLRKGKPESDHKLRKEKGSYCEVASILKTDGAHIPAIVNPTQLARWIQM